VALSANVPNVAQPIADAATISDTLADVAVFPDTMSGVAAFPANACDSAGGSVGGNASDNAGSVAVISTTVTAETAVPVLPLEVLYEDGTSETVFMPVEREAGEITTPTNSWQNDISNIFGTPKSSGQDQRKTTRLTSHRLLTSDLIISMKREDAEKQIKGTTRKSKEETREA
jgi:hypothetical protein